MTSIRIAIVSALAVATVIAGGSSTAVRHTAPASVSHIVALGGVTPAGAGPVECCD